MRLTRRDALAALAGAGIVGGGAVAAVTRERPADPRGDGAVLDVLVAAAEVIYPADVSGIHEFVEAYSLGRIKARAGYREGVREATAILGDHAREWYGEPFSDLSPGRRDALLREMGVDTAEPIPDGLAPQRVRFYVVNELQYALYTSPAGGRLVGIENPQGHPGGTDSYRRGPEE